ncbi:MAG: DegV family EDD domain-containing protein [Lachnospiraceae bacterium]|nr:DegV family EDD domain-containing protein [Lachnospiraceae bacterium]
MTPIILVAETGSDITPELASRYGIYIVPMHVSFDNETFDDGTFPAEQICSYYRQTGKLPKTSGSTPEDFEKAFDEIHAKYPEAQILYLAYSAVTTCSYQSALIAAEDRDYVTAIDTKQVSVGQAAVVVAAARALREKPQMTLEEAIAGVEEAIAHAKMCFLPDNLEFLRAGGRVSNVAYLGSRILSLHPCIEILDGKLIATRKYRGKMEKVAAQLVYDYAEKYKLKKDCLWLVYTAGLQEEVRRSVERAATECGFEKLQWIQAGGVITTHGGPAAFGLAGMSQED